MKWWGDDFQRRGGRKPGNLQMLRNKDAGPYAPWNVRKGTLGENRREAVEIATQKVISTATEIRKTVFPQWLRYVADDGYLSAQEVSGLTGISLNKLKPCLYDQPGEVYLPPDFPKPVNNRQRAAAASFILDNARKWAWRAGEIKRWLARQGT
jgi:predicted DNA-binding transcriptional regulator AlpA